MNPNTSYINLYNEILSEFATYKVINNIEPSIILRNNIKNEYKEIITNNFPDEIKCKIINYVIGDNTYIERNIESMRYTIVNSSNCINTNYSQLYIINNEYSNLYAINNENDIVSNSNHMYIN